MFIRSSLLSLVLSLVALPAFAGSNTALVCHNGHALSVNNNATSAHTGHGDHLISSEVCEDGVDNDCDGQVDEDCPVCPCYTKRDLKSWFDSSDQCFDYALGTAESPMDGTYLAYYTGEGMEAGVADYYYFNVPFCAAINLTTFEGPIVLNLTEDQYADCAEIVLEAAEELKLDCAAAP